MAYNWRKTAAVAAVAAAAAAAADGQFAVVLQCSCLLESCCDSFCVDQFFCRELLNSATSHIHH